ncbi:MAG: STAS domain-containing protein [Anaerolineaceae bacterium]|nr:STAS domain-containing protein [Anaerolineaceae bacterium]
MEVTTNRLKHCNLITVKGRVDSATAPDLSKAIAQSTDAGDYHLVIDLGGVDFLSSAGLRVLMLAQKTCKRYNRGEIKLAKVPPKIKSALDLVGFTILFNFYDDVVSAVGQF